MGDALPSAVFALVYLGALALLAAIIEITVELSKLAVAWVKRKIFAIATHITRAANFIAALGGRLVSRNLIEQIRAATAAQEGTFLREQDEQDRRLIEAYIHDLDRKRQARRSHVRRIDEDLRDGEPAVLAVEVTDGEAADPEPARRVNLVGHRDDTGIESRPLDLPDDFSVAIEHYMMYDLLAERKEFEKSLEYYSKFAEQLPQLKNLAENRMRRDRRPSMGARR